MFLHAQSIMKDWLCLPFKNANDNVHIANDETGNLFSLIQFDFFFFFLNLPLRCTESVSITNIQKQP